MGLLKRNPQEEIEPYKTKSCQAVSETARCVWMLGDHSQICQVSGGEGGSQLQGGRPEDHSDVQHKVWGVLEVVGPELD